LAGNDNVNSSAPITSQQSLSCNKPDDAEYNGSLILINEASTSASRSTGLGSESSGLSLPDCWSTEQFNYFKKDNKWLIVCNGKLGCVACQTARDIGVVNVAAEWADVQVVSNGKNPKGSLRKKIFLHKRSAKHCESVDKVNDFNVDALKSGVAAMHKKLHEETCKVFRTAYYIAKRDRPYSDHPDLVNLQELNGVNLGRILHSNVSCTEIIDHIAGDMKASLTKTIVNMRRPIGVLIDESTSLSKQSCLIVYLRVALDETAGPVTFFLDIVEPAATTAAGIESCLLQCLEFHGFNHDFLKNCWVGIGVDGASVMMGEKCGVTARLKSKFPLIVRWHCFNHRLELSVGDAAKSCSEINHFKAFMDTLYATYSVSPKAQRELSECANQLDVQLLRIGRVLNVRWVASSCRTVKAVWESYLALYAHFRNKADDRSLDGKERSKFSGMASKLANPSFIKNLGLLYDALEELGDLSLALQKSNVNIFSANKLIARQAKLFVARKEGECDYYAEACEGVRTGSFKGVTVAVPSGASVNRNKVHEISVAQFYQALADSMFARLMPESDKDFCRAVEVLDQSNLPAEMSPEYGEAQVKVLCNKFGFSFSEIKTAFRTFKDTSGGVVPIELKRLQNCIETIPVSTAACERGFSEMNIVSTALRTRLTVQHSTCLL
jgi:hypothetical protein